MRRKIESNKLDLGGREMIYRFRCHSEKEAGEVARNLRFVGVVADPQSLVTDVVDALWRQEHEIRR